MSNDFKVQWTNPALEQVQQMSPNDFAGVDPRTWHENAVRAHAATTVPQANKGRIRYGIPIHIAETILRLYLQ